MRILIQLLSILLLSCTSSSFDEEDLSCVSVFCNADTEGLGSLQGEPGMVFHHQGLDIYYILYDRIPSLGVGVPCNLPQRFQQDSLSIVFSAQTRRVLDDAQAQQAIFGNLTIHRQVRCLEITSISIN